MASSIWIKFSNHVRMQVLSICSLPNMMHSAHIPCISMTLQNVYNRIMVTSGVDMMHLLYENLTHGVHENHICQLNVWYPTRSLRWNAFGYSFRWMGCSNWLTWPAIVPVSENCFHFVLLMTLYGHTWNRQTSGGIGHRSWQALNPRKCTHDVQNILNHESKMLRNIFWSAVVAGNFVAEVKMRSLWSTHKSIT